MISHDLRSQNGKLRGKTRKPRLLGLAFALLVVVLCTAVGVAQENSGALDNVIMAGQSDFPLPIPDDGSWLQVGTVDDLAPLNGTVQSVNLKALIDHPNPDQLQMELAKDGFSSAYPLAQAAALTMEGGAMGMMNIGVFAGAPADGAWILRVRDTVPGGHGYLDGISVVAIYEPIGSRRVSSSSQSGKPTSFSLPEGAMTNSGNGQVTTGVNEDPSPRMPQRTTNWELIRFEGFGGFPSAGWNLQDQSPGGQWYWDDTTCISHSGSWSAWPAAGGANALVPCINNYANDMETWMEYGPFDLSNAYEADTDYYVKLDNEVGYDYFYFGVSHDGSNYSGLVWDGTEDWTWHDIYYNDWTGDDSVWLAFMFVSDGSVTRSGPFLDDINIWRNVLGIPVLDSISNGDGNGSFALSWSSAEGAQSYEVQEQRNGGSWSSIYTVTGISQNISGRGGGEWCYRVRARTDLGSAGAYSNVQCTWVIPDIPQISSISNSDGDGNYTVSWSSEVGASSYSLQERHNGGSWGTIYSGSSTSQSISGKSGGEWCYQARATNSAGSSAWSSIKCTTVTTAAPTLNSISNSDGDGNYDVSWSTISGASSYELQERHDGGSWGSIYSGSSTTRSISGRSAGEWCYRVSATVSGSTSGWSSTKCTTVKPAAPSMNVINNAGGSSSFTVSWTVAQGATSYELQEKYGGGAWTTVYNGSGNSRSISGQAPGQWCYQVRASNAAGNSAWSNMHCTYVKPEIPTLDAISNTDLDGNFILNWSAEAGAEYYEMEQQKDGGSWSMAGTYSASTANITGKAVGIWCFHVRAVNAGGSSSWSNTECTDVEVAAPVLAPIANPEGSSSFMLSWSAVDGSSGYELQEQHQSGSWNNIFSGPALSYQVTRRSSGQWCYQVRGVSSSGNSDWSNIECTEVENALILLPSVFGNFASYFEGPMEQEENDRAADANGPLRFGQTYRGHPDDERDFFSFYLPSDGHFTVDLENHLGQEVQLQLFYQSATEDNRITFVAEAPYIISHQGQTGIYYVFIYSTGHYNSASEYTLKITRP